MKRRVGFAWQSEVDCRVSLTMKGGMAMARRARHDTRYWAEHIALQQASGLSVREYCQRESLQAHHFYYWRKRSMAGQSASPERRALSARPARQAKAANLQAVDHYIAAHSVEQGQSVVIRLGDQATVHVPAAMLETIEAVLKMALRICEPNLQPSGHGFRSVIVRS